MNNHTAIREVVYLRTIAAVASRERLRLPIIDRASHMDPCVIACSGIVGASRGILRQMLREVPRSQRAKVIEEIRSARKWARNLCVGLGISKEGGAR